MPFYLNVSNTVFTRSRTGIQRVVRELCAGLPGEPNIIALAWQGDGFRRLSDEDKAVFLEAQEIHITQAFDLDTIRRGDVFVDLDASWADPYDIHQLYATLKSRGAIIVKLHYDAVPVLYPHFSHANTVFAFSENLSAALRYADYWWCISRAVEADLGRISRSLGLGTPNTQVLPLGADFTVADESATSGVDTAALGEYWLSVGTLEPRKNHALMLDAFDALWASGQSPNLVIVGKQGWNSDAMAKRIAEHPAYNQSLFWFKAATDAEVEALYHNAYASLCLSHYEGYGLPVAESLGRGCVTLCTEGGAMAEVAHGAALCVPLEQEAVVDAITEMAEEGTWRRYKDKAASFTVPRWAQSVAAAQAHLQELTTVPDIDFVPRQVVYISIRPESVRRSLDSVAQYMPFIDRAVILSSDAELAAIERALEGLPLQILVLSESQLGITELPEDHQIRNTYLRRTLYAHESIDPNFIAFDDDALALKSVRVEDFLSHGKHKAHYFFGRGEDWLGAFPRGTSFDRGIWRTTRYLRSGGYDTRLYNAHMPQIINKTLAAQVLTKTEGLGCDEWSIYFNLVKHWHPGLFEDQVYRAIGWPQTDAPWVPVAVSDDPLFMNFYERDTGRLNSADKASMVASWIEEIRYKKMLRDAVVPAQPELVVSSTGVSFNAEGIRCVKGSDIFIKLMAEGGAFTVRFKYGMHEREFSDQTLPRFLAFPASVFMGKQAAVLRIELASAALNDKQLTSVPVTID